MMHRWSLVGGRLQFSYTADCAEWNEIYSMVLNLKGIVMHDGRHGCRQAILSLHDSKQDTWRLNCMNYGISCERRETRRFFKAAWSRRNRQETIVRIHVEENFIELYVYSVLLDVITVNILFYLITLNVWEIKLENRYEVRFLNGKMRRLIFRKWLCFVHKIGWLYSTYSCASLLL